MRGMGGLIVKHRFRGWGGPRSPRQGRESYLEEFHRAHRVIITVMYRARLTSRFDEASDIQQGRFAVRWSDQLDAGHRKLLARERNRQGQRGNAGIVHCHSVLDIHKPCLENCDHKRVPFQGRFPEHGERDGINLLKGLMQSVSPRVAAIERLFAFRFVAVLQGKHDVSEPDRYPAHGTYPLFASYCSIVVPSAGGGHQVPVALRLLPRLEKLLPEGNDLEAPFCEPGVDSPVDGWIRTGYPEPADPDRSGRRSRRLRLRVKSSEILL